MGRAVVGRRVDGAAVVGAEEGLAVVLLSSPRRQRNATKPIRVFPDIVWLDTSLVCRRAS